MRIEDQVCSLNLALRLKELGVPQKSLFYHWRRDGDYWSIVYGQISKQGHPETYAAFSVAELGVMLSKYLDFDDGLYVSFLQNKVGCKLIINGETGTFNFGKNEADARASLLIDLIENSHVSAGDL